MKKIICIVLTAVLLLTGTVALAATIPNPVLDARGSVVDIRVTNDDGSFSGSGFAIGVNNAIEYIVTNHHVIEGDNGIITVYSDDYLPTGATVLLDKPSADLCVLKLDAPIKNMKPFVLFDGDPNTLIGEKVYTLGFPGSADVLFSRGSSTADDVSVADGIISAVKDVNSDVFGVSATALQINAAVNHGNSGGPLVNERGVVLGINTYSANSIEDSSGINGAISISELISVLEQNGIPYKASSNILYSGVLWIILIAAAAVVLFLLWLLVLRKRFKRAKMISLSDYLEKSGGRLEYDHAISLIAPAAAQLAAMHRQGRAHLAVYPQNLRVNVAAGKATLRAGKPELISGYSAPEQYNEFAQTGPFTDVYQLGAILYRLLTGERLPEVMERAGGDMGMQAKINALPLLSGVKQALRLATAMDPDIRISNADQFMAAFHIPPEMTVLPAGMAKKEHKKLEPKKKKKIIIFSIVGAVVAAACVCTALFFTTYGKAAALLKDGDYKQAEQLAAKLPDLGGVPVLKRQAQAGALIDEGKFDEARDLLSGIETLPDSQAILADIDWKQGLTLIAAGSAEEGEAYIASYLQNTPDADKNAIDYGRAYAYALAKDFATAEKIYASLGDYEDAHTQAAACAVLSATESVAEGNYLGALTILAPYKDTPEVQTLIESLQEGIYQQGINFLNADSLSAAKTCFDAIPDYKDAAKLADILGASSYESLMPYLDYDFAQKVLFQNGLIYGYLLGYWTDGNYYFQMEGSTWNYRVSFTIPRVASSGMYFDITNDGVYLSGENECLKFYIIDENTMDVYAYANGRTYRMHRQ